MTNRFEQLTSGISQVYKSIQRIKKHKMISLGLRGTHVMCIHYLSNNPDGLTATSLCEMCKEDKAGISRILSELEKLGLIQYVELNEKKKYRAKVVLTPEGKKSAVIVNSLILNATEDGGMGITDEERDVFYRVLFKISDNLNKICNELNTKGEENE